MGFISHHHQSPPIEQTILPTICIDHRDVCLCVCFRKHCINIVCTVLANARSRCVISTQQFKCAHTCFAANWSKVNRKQKHASAAAGAHVCVCVCVSVCSRAKTMRTRTCIQSAAALSAPTHTHTHPPTHTSSRPTVLLWSVQCFVCAECERAAGGGLRLVCQCAELGMTNTRGARICGWADPERTIRNRAYGV